MDVGRGGGGGQGDASPVDEQVMLGARSTPVYWVGAGVFAPLLAGTLA